MIYAHKRCSAYDYTYIGTGSVILLISLVTPPTKSQGRSRPFVSEVFMSYGHYTNEESRLSDAIKPLKPEHLHH